jgi:hypothetical protein
MSAKHCAKYNQHSYNQHFNIVITKHSLPKRQFAEVIALPDDSIKVTQIEDIIENGNRVEVSWCLPCFHQLYESSMPACHNNNANCFLHNSTDQTNCNNDNIKIGCVDCICQNFKKVIVCVFLCPYTFFMSP